MKFDLSRKSRFAFAALLTSGALIVAASLAQAQSVTPTSTDAAAPALPKSAAASTGAARMKPVRKVANAGSDATASNAGAVTTGSVAKAGTARAAAGKTSGRCTRIAFEVNDYGKEGPTKDAKALLDTHIAKWAAEKGIKKYTTGKKLVNCRLFLDFVVFDEHTCRAEAPVCW